MEGEIMMDIFSAMEQRKSARAYLDNPVTRQDIEEIFKYAGLAPSAINLQPWEFIVTYGEEKDRLVRRLLKAHAERSVPCGPGTAKPLPKKYAKRSMDALTVMETPVSRLGMTFNRFIEEGSCSFYGAPIAIIVAIDKIFPAIRYLDAGLAVSYLLLAAHAKGLATCPIGLITAYTPEIADVLGIPEEKEIILGIALGYADENSPANAFKTDREKTEEILSWYE
ncbi:MAG: nitroreductase [Deltaproteobacteria bacterium]|nr:nitroreductase [Deltaproteobacteria bacterium]